MAIFKLGAIVTEISGSLGGTTFRRGASNLVASNKSFGASKTKLLLNKQLGGIREIFSHWQFLTEQQRTDWNAEALNYEFPDKFGVMRNLTGYQLFVKLNSQALPAGFSFSDPTGISSVVSPFVFTYAEVDLSDNEFLCDIDPLEVSGWFYISAEISQDNIYQPSFIRREVLKAVELGGIISVDIYSEFMAKFPYYTHDYNIIVYVCRLNGWGFKSDYQTQIPNKT